MAVDKTLFIHGSTQAHGSVTKAPHGGTDYHGYVGLHGYNGGAYIGLSSYGIAENSAVNTVIGAVSVVGDTGYTAISITSDPDGFFNLSSAVLPGANLRNAVIPDYEAGSSHTVTLKATGASKPDIITTISAGVTNVLEVTLGALALSSLAYNTGTPASGNITGKTTGSSIALSGALPAGLTLNLAATPPTWAWDGTGAVSSGSFGLVETHPDATNSPRNSAQNWSIASAPAIAISSEFPTLKAAYEAGNIARISWIGDSTVAYAVTGAHESESTTGLLRAYLTAAGLTGVIGNQFSNGDKNLINFGVLNIPQYAAYYDPDAVFSGSWTQYGLSDTIFGGVHIYSSTAGDYIRYDPNGYYDRVELFYPTFPGAGQFDIRIGATVVASLDGNQAKAYRKTGVYNVTRTNTPIDQWVTSGTAWPGTIRVWDSTASKKLQVENVGFCGGMCSTFLNTTTGPNPELAAGNTLPILGCHLAIIQLGVNEQNTGVSAATYQANLTTLINTIKAAGSDVLVCLPPPATSGYAMDTAHRNAVGAACTAAGIGAPVDLYSGIGFNTGTDLFDTVHPNLAGNTKIVNGTGAAGSGLGGVGARVLGLV